MVSHKKERTRRYSAETITDTDYADNLELLTNTLAESLLHKPGAGSKRH